VPIVRPDERRDERTTSLGSLLETPDRFIRLPEAEPEGDERRRAILRELPGEDDGRRYALIAAVAMGLVVLCLLLSLPGQGRSPDVPTAIHPLPATAPGSDLSIPVGHQLRTHTVNADGDQDVLSIALGGPTALAPLIGSPVTADGVIVRETYDDNAFSVRSRTGAAMVVYVPDRGPTDVPLTLTPQRRVTFEGTLLAVPDDIARIVGVEAAAVAQRTGGYLVAIPETLHPVRHLRRS
jgi:hypothetical protein